MYTEDDDKGEVKKDNSNIKYSDFYMSFNDIDKEEKKTKKSKKSSSSKPKQPQVKEEEDYKDFYNTNVEEVEIDNNNGKKNIIKLIIAIVLFIVLIILLVVLFSLKGNHAKGDIELAKADITIDVGQKEYISYKVINTESSVTPKFKSSDENVAIVNESGEITAIGEGEAIITIYYTIDGSTKEKTCNIKVSNTNNVDQNISLTLSITNGKDNTWTNKDVTITPNASSPFGIESIKYAVNCDSDCEYKDITDGKITITSSGVAKIKVVAEDKKKQVATKEVTIKIDKDAPKATLIGDANITSNKDVEVCATCSDSLSGCKQSKVCRKFTASKSGQTITVEDAAGNKSNSKSFNVTINKTGAPCTLRVSSDGTVTATLREEAVYYGFNSNYTGSNEKSKKITIDVPNGKSGAKIVYYYVKNKNGTGGKCFITVVKTCECINNTSGSSCQSKCTFTSQ